MHFLKKLGRLSISGSKIFSFRQPFLGELSPNLDCFITNFKLKFEDSENIKADRVDTVVFSLHQTKCWAVLFGTAGVSLTFIFLMNTIKGSLNLLKLFSSSSEDEAAFLVLTVCFHSESLFTW